MWDYEEIDWLGNNSRYEEASNFIFSAARTNLFEIFSNDKYFITSDNLKILSTKNGHYIDRKNKPNKQLIFNKVSKVRLATLFT